MSSRYVILTPFPQADVVAAVLKLRRIDADVVATASGTVVVGDVPEKEITDWDISELLGADPTVPEVTKDTDDADISGDPDAVAAVLSKLSAYGVVLFNVKTGEDVGLETGISGVVNAYRVLDGKRGEEIPAGLLLNTLDPAIERIVLGTDPLEEISPTIHGEDVTESVLHRIFRRRTQRRDVPRGNAAIKWKDNVAEQPGDTPDEADGKDAQ
ncbi:MAG: hypothetical protein GX483_08700 [Actinomycetaceae bacterium]|nr:hypothetical protein [Actinomycetaceae bacterium]